MESQRAQNVESTPILRRYVEDQISTNFHVISTYFFEVISLIEISTFFPPTFFDLISMVEKCTLFPRTSFEGITMGKNLTSFLVKLQANENIGGSFTLLVTLKS